MKETGGIIQVNEDSSYARVHWRNQKFHLSQFDFLLKKIKELKINKFFCFYEISSLRNFKNFNSVSPFISNSIPSS